jgi:hypothetical protein
MKRQLTCETALKIYFACSEYMEFVVPKGNELLKV